MKEDIQGLHLKVVAMNDSRQADNVIREEFLRDSCGISPFDTKVQVCCHKTKTTFLTVPSCDGMKYHGEEKNDGVVV